MYSIKILLKDCMYDVNIEKAEISKVVIFNKNEEFFTCYNLNPETSEWTELSK